MVVSSMRSSIEGPQIVCNLPGEGLQWYLPNMSGETGTASLHHLLMCCLTSWSFPHVGSFGTGGSWWQGLCWLLPRDRWLILCVLALSAGYCLSLLSGCAWMFDALAFLFYGPAGRYSMKNAHALNSQPEALSGQKCLRSLLGQDSTLCLCA